MKTKLIIFLCLLVLPVFAADKPVYLSKGGKVVSDTSDTVISRLELEGWVRTATPPEVLEAGATLAADKAERQQIKALMADLKAGTGTNGERITRIEKALHRLLKDSLR